MAALPGRKFACKNRHGFDFRCLKEMVAMKSSFPLLHYFFVHKLFCLFLSLILLCPLTACGNSEKSIPAGHILKKESSINPAGPWAPNRKEGAPSLNIQIGGQSFAITPAKPPETEEENNMNSMEIIVGNKTFTAALCDNEAAKRFKEQLPMTLNMSELNGNEKYYYLSGSLPTNSSRPSGIHEGDFMLYGNNCLVLFYKSFSTSYSYTPLGRIDDPDGLADALGSGSIQITFR